MPAKEISLLFTHPSRRVRRGPLREFWTEVARRAARGQAGTCLIAGDRELRELNRKFRRKDYATDVLSFPGTGEIAVSLDRAAAQASERGHSLDQELRILMLHGALHLAGMDHEIDGGRMARAEARWRKRLGLPESLTERARA